MNPGAEGLVLVPKTRAGSSVWLSTSLRNTRLALFCHPLSIVGTLAGRGVEVDPGCWPEDILGGALVAVVLTDAGGW